MAVRFSIAAAILWLAVPALAGAQGLGLDLSEPSTPPTKAAPAKAQKPAAKPAGEDLTVGPPILVVPMGRGDGKPDLETYRTLCPALKEKFGARIIAEEPTLKALEQLKLRGPTFGMPDALAKVAEALKAPRAILFMVAPAKIEASVYAKPEAAPSVHLSYAWTKTRVLDRARAREITLDIIKQAGAALAPAPAAEPAAVAAKPVEPAKPVDGAKPAEPVKAADATKPAEPTKTADAAKPAEPAKTADAVKPAEPTKPAEPAKPTKTAEAVKPSFGLDLTDDATPLKPVDKGFGLDLTEPTPMRVIDANSTAVIETPYDPVPVQTVKQEGTSDVDDEQVRESRRTRKELQPPIALVLAGVGASLRTFKATTSAPIVPQPQGAMVGLGAELAFFPLRLSGRLARSAAGGIFLEGYYRRTLAGMLVHGGAYDGERCNVDDYTVMAGGGYRYVLGGRLPTIGLGVGWATEGTYLYCKTPVLSTQYRSIEVSLKIDQPLIGETLGIELAGGPRFIISKAAKREGAFAAELWLAWRPIGVLFFRAGARINGTWETTAKAAVPVSDLRTFVGLEVGAAF